MLKNYKNDQFQKKDLSILYSVNELLCHKNLLKTKQRILIAVSGGQDSMCLIKLLFRLQVKWNWKLGIIHCDHGWNSISKLQANYVSQLAHSMELDYYQAITINSVNSEVSARTWRYHLIKQIADTHKYDVIITAHTTSDRIETFLYNLFRGCSLNGLQALRWKRTLIQKKYTNIFFVFKNIEIFFQLKCQESMYQTKINKSVLLAIVRPLLGVSRLQIRLLINNWQFPIWLDPSNRSIRIYRNRLRHRLIPYIRSYFQPQFDQAISNWLELMYSENEYISQLTTYIRFTIQMLIKNDKEQAQYIALPIAVLNTLPIFLQRRIIKEFIEKKTRNKIVFQEIENLRIRLLNKMNLDKNIKIHDLSYSNSILFQNKTLLLSYKSYLTITDYFIFIEKY